MAEILKDFSETNRKLAKKILEEQATGRKTKPLIGSTSITSGARAGALLGDMQRKEATLVGKLSKDFPIRQFDSMPTKAQLKAVQYSGLNPNERWNLLNLSMPIKTLSMLNDIENRVSEQTITRQDAAALTQSAVQLAAEQQELESGNTAYLPPLQKNLLRTELEGRKDVLKRIIETGAPLIYPERQRIPQPTIAAEPAKTTNEENTEEAKGYLSSRDAMDRKKDEMWEKVETRSGDAPEVNPSANVTTDSVPLKGIISEDSNLDSIIAFFGMPATIAMLQEKLDEIDVSILPASAKHLYDLAMKKMTDGNLSAQSVSAVFDSITRIKQHEQLAVAKTTSQPGVTWDATMINNQNEYSNEVGTFGSEGTLADNGCGYMAINNANQILGFQTNFDDTCFELNSQSNWTTLINGTRGMNPLVIGNYFREKGCDVDLYFDINNAPKTYDAYIMLYLYKKAEEDGTVNWGGHYVAIEYDENSDNFIVYNLDSSNSANEGEDLEVFLPNNPKILQYVPVVWGINNPDEHYIEEQPVPNSRKY